MIPKKKKPKTLSKYKKELDTIFSQFIRLRDADGNGICYCVTCGKPYPWKEIQNGHFISRSKLATRFDEDNCHAQCYGCNVCHYGEVIKYMLWMENQYGRQFVDKLIKKSEEIVKISIPQYKESIADYKERVAQLKSEL